MGTPAAASGPQAGVKRWSPSRANHQGRDPRRRNRHGGASGGRGIRSRPHHRGGHRPGRCRPGHRSRRPHGDPGWVDVHTHYDGQVTWDSELAPSSWHGVTTLVMGNCGVGFARPARPPRLAHRPHGGRRGHSRRGAGRGDPVGVGDLSRVSRRPGARRWTVDVGTQVPHAAVRAYVMGERGASNEAATAEDIEAMREIVLEAIRAGALGFSTSRTLFTAPSTASWSRDLRLRGRVLGIASALGEAGAGVFELAPLGSAGEMLQDAWQEVDWMRRLSAAIDRPVSYVLLQADDDPELWRKQLAASLEACAEGARLFPQSRDARRGSCPGTTRRYASSPSSRPTWSCGPAAGRPPSWRRRWPTPRYGARLCRGHRPPRPRPMPWPRPTSAPSCSATRPTTSRATSGHWPAWPRRAAVRRWRWPTTRWPVTAARDCSTSRSSTTPPATSTTCAG